MGHVVTPDQDVPPQNLEAERSVLGAMMVSERALRQVRVETGLQAAHFHFDKHREVFSAIVRVSEERGTADELLVAAVVPEQLRPFVAELTARAPAPGNAVHYAEIVTICAGLRVKLEGAKTIIAGVGELDRERQEELITEGLQLAASDFSIEAEPTTPEEVMDEFFDWYDSDEDPEVFELPWPKLNQSMQGGYRRKQMSVLAGWPKMGKSFVLDQKLGAFTKQGKRCAIFAPEVSRHERVIRWLTMSTGIASEKLFRKTATKGELKQLLQARKKGLPFSYFEAAGWGVDKIAERVIYGGYDVVAIDPVTKVPGYEKTEEAQRIIGRFTELATRANCHVILVSHLHRGRGTLQSGAKPRPTTSDLRGSGMLEGDAHAIMFLHRRQDDKANVLAEGELYFDRSRLGPPVGIEVVQLAKTLTFVPIEERPPADGQEKLEVGSLKPPHDREPEFPF